MYSYNVFKCCANHKLSINRPTKKEKSPSDGHCQCQKEMDDHLACQQFLTESHIVTRLANERASFLNKNDINDISFLERLSLLFQFLTESHIVTRLANERASFLSMNDINDISFLERLSLLFQFLTESHIVTRLANE
jgi:hypothetical protein